jgi:hypothetical protein
MAILPSAGAAAALMRASGPERRCKLGVSFGLYPSIRFAEALRSCGEIRNGRHKIRGSPKRVSGSGQVMAGVCDCRRHSDHPRQHVCWFFAPCDAVRQCQREKGRSRDDLYSTREATTILPNRMMWPSMLDPTPELPDDTLVGQVKFPTRVLNALNAAGLRTVGEVREASDDMLLSLPDLGHRSVAHLRQTLGLPSRDGVRPR